MSSSPSSPFAVVFLEGKYQAVHRKSARYAAGMPVPGTFADSYNAQKLAANLNTLAAERERYCA